MLHSSLYYELFIQSHNYSGLTFVSTQLYKVLDNPFLLVVSIPNKVLKGCASTFYQNRNLTLDSCLRGAARAQIRDSVNIIIISPADLSRSPGDVLDTSWSVSVLSPSARRSASALPGPDYELEIRVKWGEWQHAVSEVI